MFSCLRCRKYFRLTLSVGNFHNITMSFVCTHALPQSLSPLADSRVNDSLLQIIQHFNEALLQFVDFTYANFTYATCITCCCMTPRSCSRRVQIWAVWRPEVRTDEVRCLAAAAGWCRGRDVPGRFFERQMCCL